MQGVGVGGFAAKCCMVWNDQIDTNNSRFAGFLQVRGEKFSAFDSLRRKASQSRVISPKG